VRRLAAFEPGPLLGEVILVLDDHDELARGRLGTCSA
jgi:hypothetical protein